MTTLKEIDERIRILERVKLKDATKSAIITGLKEWRADKIETIKEQISWLNMLGTKDYERVLQPHVYIDEINLRISKLLKQLSGTEDKT